jgi:DNA-directed RNA polymerase subunit M/transcription elongation factor TFIIS
MNVIIDTLPIESYGENYNALRRAKLGLFNNCMSEYEEYKKLKKEKRNKIILHLERECFNYVLSELQLIEPNELFDNLYNAVCAKISSDIDYNGNINNKKLVKKILDENIKDIPSMRCIDLFPDKYSNIIEKIDMSKNAVQTIKTSAMYTCKRCKKNACIIENRYNRSLDEGTNLTIICAECGYEMNA